MVHDIPTLSGVGGTHNANGLVKGNENQILLVPGFHCLAIHSDRVARKHLIPDLDCFTVDRHIAVLNVPVGLPPGTQAAFTDVLVQAGGAFSGHENPVSRRCGRKSN
jgi:hypothetical protein